VHAVTPLLTVCTRHGLFFLHPARRRGQCGSPCSMRDTRRGRRSGAPAAGTSVAAGGPHTKIQARHHGAPRQEALAGRAATEYRIRTSKSKSSQLPGPSCFCVSEGARGPRQPQAQASSPRSPIAIFHTHTHTHTHQLGSSGPKHQRPAAEAAGCRSTFPGAPLEHRLSLKSEAAHIPR
jgi:hypothetical protein